MKKILFGILAVVFTTATAHAYTSGQANPIAYGSYDQEYRTVVKSTTAGVSDAIVVGDILSYDITNNNDGYTVTRVGSNTVNGVNAVACIATQAIATGNIQEFRCISKGYVPAISYVGDGTNAIVANQKVCANSSGQATTCATCDNTTGANSCKYGPGATPNSAITSLSAKGANGSGTPSANGLAVYINTR